MIGPEGSLPFASFSAADSLLLIKPAAISRQPILSRQLLGFFWRAMAASAKAGDFSHCSPSLPSRFVDTFFGMV